MPPVSFARRLCCNHAPFVVMLMRFWDQVSIVVSALPSMVVEVWSLYRAVYELLASSSISALIASDEPSPVAGTSGRGSRECSTV
jgi:hypothetical protein